MPTISDIWKNNKELFEGKSIDQILAFSGDGKLKDANKTSKEFRDFLKVISTDYLRKFAEECLTLSFTDSGFALQDILNEIGTRLEFEVEHGLYHGKKNAIGFDGIWITDNYGIVVEVKTTDAYRINLDDIANYRRKLIELNKIDKFNSSILIIVGRQDTGDFEAQIRGSKHAWDIRLISVDALIKLLELKEKFNDLKTLQQINQLLKPLEYTRIDKLIELIFIASNDIELENEVEADFEQNDINLDNAQIVNQLNTEPENQKVVSEKKLSAEFQKVCHETIQNYLKKIIIKQGRAIYDNKEASIGVVIIVSKEYDKGNYVDYWFGFHQHQKEFLTNYKIPYVAFCCGSDNKIFLVPINKLEKILDNLSITKLNNSFFWHVVIASYEDKHFIKVNSKKGDSLEITDNMIIK